MQKTQEKLHISAEQFHQMESNQADRVEKSLLKNLLIGYIVATNNDKMQILKLISSVLDFNQQEYEKVGLHRTHTGWLDSIFQTNTSVDRTGIFVYIYYKYFATILFTALNIVPFFI